MRDTSTGSVSFAAAKVQHTFGFVASSFYFNVAVASAVPWAYAI